MRRTFPNIIRNNPKIQSSVTRRIRPQPPHVDLVRRRCQRGRSREFQGRLEVDHRDAGGPRERADASRGLSARSKLACTLRLCPKNTGTRTAVALMASSGTRARAEFLPQAPLFARDAIGLQ